MLGDYPERDPDARDEPGRRAAGVPPAARRRDRRLSLRSLAAFVAAVHRAAADLAAGDGADIPAQVADLGKALASRGLDDDVIARCFALVRHVSASTLGMTHHDTQLIAGRVMIGGALAEMQTGEGKTLAATLPACTAALAGIPVHVITANDYLAGRDAATMGPLYRALGLTVGAVTADTPPEARRQAYARDITYTTAKQLAFDYLRDRITMGRRRGRLQLKMERLYSNKPRLDQLTLRGLCFAIVDEADSVLIDEARTPFIIARETSADELASACQAALALADELAEGTDYAVDRRARRITLTDAGRDRLADRADRLPGGNRRRVALVEQALSARLLFVRDRDYLVRDGKIAIIDGNTGRILADRSWERGLHQMIECKEDCEVTAPRETMASLTFQRLFPRYLRLCGMTGTAREVASELWSTYRLPVVAIPTHRRCRRRALPLVTARDRQDKLAAIVRSVRAEHDKGRPVLIGTRTVEDSERLSERLTEAGLPHDVLNARQDASEAAIVARAGQPGQITVATNMAGRGTDIALGTGVSDAGGLHVILSEPNEARRLDRQLYGRCARQGEPGSYQMFVAPDDDVLARFSPPGLGRLVSGNPGNGSAPRRLMSTAVISTTQRRCEAHQRAARRELRKMQDTYDKLLAFAGQGI